MRRSRRSSFLAALVCVFAVALDPAVAQEAVAAPERDEDSESRSDESVTLAQIAGAAAAYPESDAAGEHVVVTGTNISDSPAFVPETIYNRDVVARAGSRSLGDFFQQLPENSGPTFTENQNDSLAPGAAAVALRGLSPDATLVLVNSRRVAPYPFAQTGITAFVDLNSLPLAAIHQIDILRDGASAIYGTDAIAGVVNLRLIKRFHGAQINAGYGNTTDTDTAEYRAALCPVISTINAASS